MRTLILQSCSTSQQQGWQKSCLATVRQWAESRGAEYRFIGDEIFDVVPGWYLDKCKDKLPVATDYARLLLLQSALQEGYEQVVWLDADVFIIDQSFTLDFAGTCAFGQEVWIERKDGKLSARRNIHNAIAVFRQHCAVLPFLIHCVESLMRRVDPAHIAPQFVGPKLLQALHPLADFAVLPAVGALSPEVVTAILQGGGEALDLLRKQTPLPKAVNLCASLIGDKEAQAVIESLQRRGLSSN